MMNIFENLSWLQAAPDDFTSKLGPVTTGSQLRMLAQYALSDNQLRKLAKKHKQLAEAGINLEPLIKMKVGVISNATTQLISTSLEGTALRYGIALDVIEAEFNQLAQEAFAETSLFTRNALSMILVAADYRGLPLRPCPGDLVEAENNIRECLSFIKTLVESLRKKTGAQIILQNIVPPVELLSGSFEGRLPGTIPWIIQRLNIELDKLITDDLCIFDAAALASTVGLSRWHDSTLWNLAKLPFAQSYTPLYADYVCRLLAAKSGKARRCLILDLDNTLWGGVIGDDGLDGILIGNGNPTGEAHLQLQQVILALRARGIVLAVSSKNEDAIARQPFKEHPDMLLREEHIAVFQANWLDKATNIRTIAKTLSLGLESIVFLDDNPVERMQVRRELPEVAVPELPDDPALYARVLISAGYFEATAFSEEDKKRANFYNDNAKRVEILSKSSDMDSYLKALKMEISLADFDQSGRSRIVQLISKSNQFNLTTKRYTESDVKKLESNAGYFTRQIRLRDSLGDNGMISVVICKKNQDSWEIDTWLMSCRVLGRQVEDAVLQDIVKNAEAAGVSKLIGYYSPTAKNIIVKDHYRKLGFNKTHSIENDEFWELTIKNYKKKELPFDFRKNSKVTSAPVNKFV